MHSDIVWTFWPNPLKYLLNYICLSLNDSSTSDYDTCLCHFQTRFLQFCFWRVQVVCSGSFADYIQRHIWTYLNAMCAWKPASFFVGQNPNWTFVVWLSEWVSDLVWWGAKYQRRRCWTDAVSCSLFIVQSLAVTTIVNILIASLWTNQHITIQGC